MGSLRVRECTTTIVDMYGHVGPGSRAIGSKCSTNGIFLE